MNIKKTIRISAFALLSTVGVTAHAQETPQRSLLASYSEEVKFSPAPDLSPQEIEMKVNANNPYTLYRKGSVAEYAFEYKGKPGKFKDKPYDVGGGPSYIQQVVMDEKIENGLLVAYVKLVFLNKKLLLSAKT